GGKGVATLAQVRGDPAVLGQLRFDDVSYDVTPEKAKNAEVVVYVPVTALSPRMRLLQDKLLREPHWVDESGIAQPYPAAVRVKLAEEEPGALASVRRASGGEAKYWREGAGLLRTFVPREEGGTDEPGPFPVAALRGFVNPNNDVVIRLGRRRVLELA